MIKLKSLLVEKTLYHGTISDFVPSIKQHGLLPTVGEFVKNAYAGSVDNIDDEINDYLKELVFATDKKQLDKAVTAITAQVGIKLNKDFHSVTDEEFRLHGALAIIKDGDSVMKHRPPDDENYYGQHPFTVEPGDYFSDDYVNVDYVLTKDKLISFLKRLSRWPRKYSPDYNKARLSGKLAPWSVQEIKKFDINRSSFVVDPRPMTKVKEFVESLLKDLKQLQYELGFSNVRIHYVVQDRAALARYAGVIDKTVEPIITISTRVLQRWAQQFGRDLATEVETVLVHEFGHAYLEIHTGMSTSQQVKHSGPVEAAVVEFSERFVEDRNIEEAKKILDDFIEDFGFHTGQITEVLGG
jgi:hypothetical protein